jgi:hypothetical protein
MAGFSSKKKIENRKLEDVLIVKLITSMQELCNYHIITSQRYDNRRINTEVQKRSKKLDPFEFGRWRY